MFFTRRDGALKERAKRRLKSSRASVFLEFAFIAPLMVLVISAMLEFAMLWDAKVMANHTAWTVGRIATVRGVKDSQWKLSTKLSDQLNKGVDTSSWSGYIAAIVAPLNAMCKGADRFNDARNIPALFLMSTCCMGSWGKTSDDIKNLLQEMILAPIKKLKEELIKSISGKVKDLIGKLPEFIKGSGIMEQVLKWINDAVNKIFEAIMTPIANAIAKLLESILPTDIIDHILTNPSNRQLRQIVHAARRIAHNPNVVTVKALTDEPYKFCKNNTKFLKEKDTSLSYPRCLDKFMTADDYYITHDSNWPANYNEQDMIKVTVAWPFERTWLFPVVSGFSNNSDEAPVKAMGHSIVYPQPDISLANLLSKGAAAYDEGSNTNTFADIIKQLEAEIRGFMKCVEFGMWYRGVEEQWCAYDSNSKGSNSFKGIGSGGLHNHDGLVYWMGRGPVGSPTSHDAWKKHNKPWDYARCFDALGGGYSETKVFWYGIEGHAATSKLYDNLRSIDRGHGMLWFWWGTQSICPDVHQRYWKDFSQYAEMMKPTQRNEKGGKGDDGIDQNHYGDSFVPDPEDYSSAWLTKSGYSFNLSKVAMKGVPTLSYDDYRKMSAKIPKKISAWINTYYDSGSAAGFIRREKNLAYTNAILQVRYLTVKKMAHDCAQELHNNLEGDIKDSKDGELDFGVTEQEILQHPEQAAKKIREKFDHLKDDSFRILAKIDQAIIKMEKVRESSYRTMQRVAQAREDELKLFQAKIGALAMLPPYLVDPSQADEMRRRLKDNGSGYRSSYESDLAAAEAAARECAEAISEAYALEVEYGKLFGLSAAKKGDKKIDDIDPGRDPSAPKDPNEPAPSSPSDGSDSDGTGDKWTHTDKEWTAE